MRKTAKRVNNVIITEIYLVHFSMWYSFISLLKRDHQHGFYSKKNLNV